jgi:hypothetical protein
LKNYHNLETIEQKEFAMSYTDLIDDLNNQLVESRADRTIAPNFIEEKITQIGRRSIGDASTLTRQVWCHVNGGQSYGPHDQAKLYETAAKIAPTQKDRQMLAITAAKFKQSAENTP